MRYVSLSLENDGGISSALNKMEQRKGASLCIGIGGTGIAALAQLKREVFRQLKPDDPDSPIPQYQHIRFLAIDAEEPEERGAQNAADLRMEERFSIAMPDLAVALKKNSMENDPVMSWMEVDKIRQMSIVQGTGGVRQVGRFLLLSKADALREQIKRQCTAALQGMPPFLNIFVLTSLSGGTGSGCFLDVCYIVRDVMKELELESEIDGLFFLPDVATANPAVAAVPAVVEHCFANGYAALKELDYLMDLWEEQDWFCQNYGTFSVKTQDPPVNQCCLLSARKADGSLLADGLERSIHAAVYAIVTRMARGEKPDWDGTRGLRMMGHLSPVKSRSERLRNFFGAIRYYHALGASCAEVPVVQIETYLATGFYRRFEESTGCQNVSITPDEVAALADSWGLKAEELKKSLAKGCPELALPDVDKNVMKTMCPVQAGKTPEPWWAAGNAWLDECSGKYVWNRETLNGALTSNLASRNNDASLIGKVFRELCALAQDPDYGPYHAACLLKEGLQSCAKDLQSQAMREAARLYPQLEKLDAVRAQASEKLASANRFNVQSRYETFKQRTQDCYEARNHYDLWMETAKTAGKFAEDLQELDKKFFTPLITMLDALDETFRADEEWLRSGAAKITRPGTWHILELEDVKKHLDKVIEAVTPRQLVTDFVGEVLSAPEEWLQNDDEKIGRFISKYMDQVFHAEFHKGLQDYLFLKYPQAGDNVWELAGIIRKEIFTRAYDDAMPMFWRDPRYDMESPHNAVHTGALWVPSDSAAFHSAASDYVKAHVPEEYHVREAYENSLNYQILVQHYAAGVPLYAYRGMPQLKECYDAAVANGKDVGIHLYARTGRRAGNQPDVDWHTYLPEPLTYSFQPELFPAEDTRARLQLYQQGRECGVLFLEPETKDGLNRDFTLRLSAPVEIPECRMENFIADAVTLNRRKIEEERARLHDWLEHGRDKENGAEHIRLQNDGYVADQADLSERVRQDHFLHMPRLQEKVAAEVEKTRQVQAALQAIDTLEPELEKYVADLKYFCNGLFAGLYQLVNFSGGSVFVQGESKKIARVQYVGEMHREVNLVEIFSDSAQPEIYPFAESFPLYQAFLKYCALESGSPVRADLNDRVERFLNRAKTVRDVRFGKRLEAIYTPDRCDEIARQAGFVFPDKAAEIAHFYAGVAYCIEKFKSEFRPSEWSGYTESVVPPFGTPVLPPVPTVPPQPEQPTEM